MHTSRVFVLAPLCLAHRSVIAVCLLLAVALPSAEGQTTKPKPVAKPASSSKPVEDPAAANRKKDARRAQLATEITRHQSLMERYDKQDSFKLAKSGQKPITPEQYAAAKAARDRAQRERDELAH